MNSEQHYKVFICTVILGQLETSKLQQLQYYFLENFRRILKHYESKNLIPLSIAFSNPIILVFLFLRKIP